MARTEETSLERVYIGGRERCSGLQAKRMTTCQAAGGEESEREKERDSLESGAVIEEREERNGQIVARNTEGSNSAVTASQKVATWSSAVACKSLGICPSKIENRHVTGTFLSLRGKFTNMKHSPDPASAVRLQSLEGRALRPHSSFLCNRSIDAVISVN